MFGFKHEKNNPELQAVIVFIDSSSTIINVNGMKRINVCSLHQTVTKCNVPNFFVLIFVVVIIQIKKRQPGLFSFRIAATTIKPSELYFAFGF